MTEPLCDEKKLGDYCKQDFEDNTHSHRCVLTMFKEVLN